MSKDKPVLEVVKGAKKPKPTKTGGGGGSGSGQEQKRFGDYAIIGGAFHQIKPVRTGREDQSFVDIPLCDFTCRIIEEINQDDGLQDRSFLRIEGVRQDGVPLPAADVPSTKFHFSQSSWVNDTWGTLAFVFPGTQKKDNLRAAIHLYSKLEGDVPRRQIYQYTGWKEFDGHWKYLTGSGAITAEGLIDQHEVDLGTGHMCRYSLPAIPETDELKMVATSVLDLLEVCPDKLHVGAVLLSAVARAPLGECHPTDFALFVHGVTGAKKSSIAAVPLAFFGDFNARRFPANFSDTDNDLEAKAFQAKDGVFVVDDFKPSINQSEAARLHAKAERFVRNTGNQAGRGRRGSDMQAKAAPYNRSLSIITGEDTPKGPSLLGRLLILALTRVDVDINTLSRLQKAAEAGTLAKLMAAYLQWLSPRMDELKKEFPQMVTALRNAAIRDGFACSHPRAPEIYANLVAGMEIFLDFMNDTGLFSSEQCSQQLSEIDQKLQDAFSEQGAYQVEQDEVERFLALLRACFASGNAHIACRLNQGPPSSRPYTWGWRSDSSGSVVGKDFNPMGDCIGWYCDKQLEVWLEQNAAFAAVQRLAKTQGDAFLLTAPSLWRRMHERGLILATEARGNGPPRLDVKKMIGGRKKRVMVLSAELIESG